MSVKCRAYSGNGGGFSAFCAVIFRSHAVHFFRAKLNKKSGCCFKPSSNFFFVSLLQLFDTLVSFFPEHMTQPKGNLVDLITF